MFTRFPRRFREAIGLLFIPALLLAVYLLPPDTSFSQVKELGVLRVCLPDSYPPLVMVGDSPPGIDVEVLQAIAEKLEVRLSLNPNAAIGRDFNPRNWRLTRAQCQVIAGGVVDSPTTRSFLDVTSPYLETGWALISPGELTSLQGATVGFYAGVTSLDRIPLSRYLSEQGAVPVVVQQVDDLVEGLSLQRFDAGVTEALLARQLAFDHGWKVSWLPGLDSLPMVIGLWKGDLTLKRRIVAALESLKREGVLERILDSYELAMIEEDCQACRPLGD